MVGTLNYIAPEQIKGHECDERSDLYSLACVLYELLSGSKPFVGQTEYELIRAQLEVDPEPLTASMPDLEPHIDQAVMRALAKNPDDRFSSVAEFAETLGTSAVQDSAVAIVKEQVRAAGRPSNESRHGEGLVLDDPSSDPHSILSTSVFQGLSGLQPPEVQAPPRPRKPRRAMAAVAAAVLVIVMGGSYYVYRVEQNSSALVIKATPELPGNPVETPAAPPPGKPAIAQAAPPPAPGKPAITQAPAPSRQPSAPTLSQYDHPGPEEASTQAQSSAASQSSASSQQAQTETVAPADDGTKPSSPPQPPATDATTAKTIAGLVSSYSQDGWPVINGVTIRLDGVGALAPGQAKPVSDWIAIHGNYLDCTASQIGEYRCLTQQNLDLAQAILLNGAARTSTDAAPAYRDAEANARIAKRGLWR
jgi:serine/threonine-protein kinase